MVLVQTPTTLERPPTRGSAILETNCRGLAYRANLVRVCGMFLLQLCYFVGYGDHHGNFQAAENRICLTFVKYKDAMRFLSIRQPPSRR
jgi:hypothetical protein